MSTGRDWDRWEQRRAAALAEFEPWRRFLGLANWGRGVSLFSRVQSAMWAVREWRSVGNQPADFDEQARVAIRVAADTLASQIEAAATATQDPSTVAWVAAGLRCPDQPFCTGCRSCQTVTAPLRPCAEPHRGIW